MHLPFCPFFSDCLMREVRKTYINILEKVALTLNLISEISCGFVRVARVACVMCPLRREKHSEKWV